ncbi:MAG: cytosine permease, partial [Kutzneria sp.]|nr:cytosine permease [Kutzneria sp.]
VVSPSYDFSNAFPRRITFATGGLITGVIGVLIQPWRLIGDPNVYIFAWLNFYGGALAPVAGVLIAGYWVVGRTRLNLVDLYRDGGAYWFAHGWNWRALVAVAVGAVLAVGGAYSATGQGGPFPAGGLIPVLKPFYDYSWVTGLVAAFLTYLLLSRPAAQPRPVLTVPLPAGED